MAYAPPNGPAGDKNAYQRSIIWIIRPINGSPVGRMQYAPTQGYVNALRSVHATTVKQSNAARFAPPTQCHTPNAARFSHATTVKQSNAARFTYSNEWHGPVCVALGYIAIVELLRRAAFHAFRGMA